MLAQEPDQLRGELLAAKEEGRVGHVVEVEALVGGVTRLRRRGGLADLDHDAFRIHLLNVVHLDPGDLAPSHDADLLVDVDSRQLLGRSGTDGCFNSVIAPSVSISGWAVMTNNDAAFGLASQWSISAKTHSRPVKSLVRSVMKSEKSIAEAGMLRSFWVGRGRRHVRRS